MYAILHTWILFASGINHHDKLHCLLQYKCMFALIAADVTISYALLREQYHILMVFMTVT